MMTSRPDPRDNALLSTLGVPSYRSFPQLFGAIDHAFVSAPKVHSKNWQGIDISQKPEAAMHELRDVSFKVPYYTPLDSVDGQTYAEDWAHEVKPNMPWAEDHFQERVGGHPINPGVEWANWPYGHSAANFLEGNGQFNHNYMERYWPKFAGSVNAPTRTADDFKEATDQLPITLANKGIRYKYGDLNDVVDLLIKDPLTRQAYLPIFFPEDTGGLNGRVPCTLGYQFMLRESALHITYYIRSCDYIRHMRDDVYLTLRLQSWVLHQLGIRNRQWRMVGLGDFQMHISSLHMFRNDWLAHVSKMGLPIE